MIPPTSIDGTDITGATIDGTDVQEITVDGDTVFTAETVPVAYSNLIAWYPFDSSFYGGSDADDVTALFDSGQSGDSTAYDGTVESGVSYVSSGGVTDINAGASSGAFDFNGTGDTITINPPNPRTADFSIGGWTDGIDAGGGQDYLFSKYDGGGEGFRIYENQSDVEFAMGDSSTRISIGPTAPSDGNYHHYMMVRDGDDLIAYIDGNEKAQTSGVSSIDVNPSGSDTDNEIQLGNQKTAGALDGLIDDFRIYDTALTSTEVDTIYNNTKPSGHSPL